MEADVDREPKNVRAGDAEPEVDGVDEGEREDDGDALLDRVPRVERENDGLVETERVVRMLSDGDGVADADCDGPRERDRDGVPLGDGLPRGDLVDEIETGGERDILDDPVTELDGLLDADGAGDVVSTELLVASSVPLTTPVPEWALLSEAADDGDATFEREPVVDAHKVPLGDMVALALSETADDCVVDGELDAEADADVDSGSEPVIDNVTDVELDGDVESVGESDALPDNEMYDVSVNDGLDVAVRIALALCEAGVDGDDEGVTDEDTSVDNDARRVRVIETAPDDEPDGQDESDGECVALLDSELSVESVDDGLVVVECIALPLCEIDTDCVSDGVADTEADDDTDAKSENVIDTEPDAHSVETVELEGEADMTLDGESPADCETDTDCAGDGVADATADVDAIAVNETTGDAEPDVELVCKDVCDVEGTALLDKEMHVVSVYDGLVEAERDGLPLGDGDADSGGDGDAHALADAETDAHALDDAVAEGALNVPRGVIVRVCVSKAEDECETNGDSDAASEAEAAPDAVDDVQTLTEMLALEDADALADTVGAMLVGDGSDETDTLGVAVVDTDALCLALTLGDGVHVCCAESPVPRQHGHDVGTDEFAGQKKRFGQSVGKIVAADGQ